MWIGWLKGLALGVVTGTSSRSRRRFTPQTKALTPEPRRIQELEARIDRLEREKAILKKATALLMADEINRTRW